MLLHEVSDLSHQMKELLNRTDCPISNSHGVLITTKMLYDVINLLDRWDYELTNYSLALSKLTESTNIDKKFIQITVEYGELLNLELATETLLNSLAIFLKEKCNE